MNNRYIKIFICVLMVCCLLFCITASAFAAVPIAIGEIPGIAGAIGSLIASQMGVDFGYNDVSAQAIDDFIDYQNTLNYAMWLQATEDGKALLNIGYDALQALGLASADKIDALSIADYTSGIASQDTIKEWDGYELFVDGSYTHSNNLGPAVTLPTKAAWQIGTEYYVTASNSSYASCSILREDNSYFLIKFYYEGNLISTRSVRGNFAFGSAYSLRWYALSDNKVVLGVCVTANKYYDYASEFVGSVIIANPTITYSADVVDTSILNNLPSTAGLQISVPATGLETTAELAEKIVQGVLENSANISATIVQDAGSPTVFDQTISDTPYNVLDGALDNIRSGIGSIAGSISGTISDSLTGIQEAVNSIAGTIEAADAGFVQSFINGFLNVFQSAFDGVSSHLGIWHYVVSWIGSISSCFSWCLSAVSSAGSIFMAPIYATFAGTVVIAVYRRFGK